MSGLIYGSEEGRSKAAVTHLALARSQNTRTGILGFTKEKSVRSQKKKFFETQKIKYERQKKLQIRAAASLFMRRGVQPAAHNFNEITESELYCMRKNRALDKNHMVVACLFAVCVLLVIIIFWVSGRTVPATGSAETLVTREDVADAYSFLNQEEAVQAALETVDGSFTYKDYQDFLEQLHLWEAGNFADSADWEAREKENVSFEALMESRNQIAELFEAAAAKQQIQAAAEPEPEAVMPHIDENTVIRVLLLQNDEPTGKEIYFSANTDYSITWNGHTKTKKKNKVIRAGQLKLAVGQTAVVEAQAGEVYLADEHGNRDTLGYSGKFEITRYENGYAVVNEVLIENYLYGVVQSEMPAYFKEEALKAQAVCARTYIVTQLMQDNYPEYDADVDDSVRYQAYNQTAPDARVVAAVDATRGQILMKNELPIHAYFFSTSHGMTSGMEIWELEDCDYLQPVRGKKDGKALDLSDEETFRAYIEAVDEADYDYASNSYRWKATLDISEHEEEARTLIQGIDETHPEYVIIKNSEGEEADASALAEFGEAERLVVLERSASGAVLRLQILFSKGEVQLANENYIRQVLGLWMNLLQYKDGSSTDAGNMLPSAYFYVQPIKEGIVLFGGGLGHGIGMSQYGADGMATEGASMQEILMYYYRDVELCQLYAGES